MSFKRHNSAALNRRQCCQPAYSSLCWSGAASTGLESWVVSAHTLQTHAYPDSSCSGDGNIKLKAV